MMGTSSMLLLLPPPLPPPPPLANVARRGQAAEQAWSASGGGAEHRLYLSWHAVLHETQIPKTMCRREHRGQSSARSWASQTRLRLALLP